MVSDLNKIDLNVRYISEILPPVRGKGDIQPFNQNKIYESLMKETGLSSKKAADIATKVVKRIISSQIEWLSAPEIREICCHDRKARDRESTS